MKSGSTLPRAAHLDDGVYGCHHCTTWEMTWHLPKCNQLHCHCPACHIPPLSLHLSRNHPTLLRCRNSQNPAKQTRRRIPFRRPMRLQSQHRLDRPGCSPTVNSWINAKNKTWDSMLPLSTSQKLST